jgi:hypothetical protein
MAEEIDSLKEFETEETLKRKIPTGWLILFWALILWGIYYFVSYTPGISGWSQEKAFLEQSSKQ